MLPAITQGYLAKYSPIQLTSSSWDEQWLLFVCIYYRSVCGRWAARRHGLSHCAPPWGETMIAAFLAAPLRARLHQDILMQMKAGGGSTHSTWRYNIPAINLRLKTMPGILSGATTRTAAECYRGLGQNSAVRMWRLFYPPRAAL